MKQYTGRNLEHIAYPLGGIGAGTLCIEGTGSFGSTSIRNAPAIDFIPDIFSALTIKGEPPVSKVIEGPIPNHKVFARDRDSARGHRDHPYGLPRFSDATFSSRFPFARIDLSDDTMPLNVHIKAWSPFTPGEADPSSMPFAGIEYFFENPLDETIEGVYYFCAPNFMKINEKSRVRPVENGFVLEQDSSKDNPHHEGAFSATVDQKDAKIDTAWFRGIHYDTRTMLWNAIARGEAHHKTAYNDPEKGESPGGTIAVPFKVAPGQIKRIVLRFAWYVPKSALHYEDDVDPVCERGRCSFDAAVASDTYVPYYTTLIDTIDHAYKRWRDVYKAYRDKTSKFTDALYASTLPEPIMEAVTANLSILKSPTLLRQTDGRMWGFEGCADTLGCCAGSCTHVYNYAQALPNLFPSLERTFRETEFNEMQDPATGHQNFRAYLPIRKAKHEKHAASDGQLGGIIKLYRDWRISGDTAWMKSLWGKAKKSLDFCIGQWDPDKEGILKEPHHNTYDIEFWGPESLSTTFYLGALKAFIRMGEAIGESVDDYQSLYDKGRKYLESKLFNGEYFHQNVMVESLNYDLFTYKSLSHNETYLKANEETRKLVEEEGPKYQYKNGCLSDSVLGVWLSELSGLSHIIDEGKLRANLESVYRYNFKQDLSLHANPQRSGYTINNEPGLLLCTWPKGGKPSLPFIYSDEVWTGIEYQVASHLLMKGYTQKALDIVKGARSRYDGTVRNPFDEYECGHWYTRAMASYALLQGYTGVRYDAVSKTLYVSTRNSGVYRTFLATSKGYGTIHVSNDHVEIDTVSGVMEIDDIVYVA